MEFLRTDSLDTALRRADCSKLASADINLPFGFEADNYIGASPQKNVSAAG